MPTPDSYLKDKRIVFVRFKDQGLKDAVESLGGKVTATISSLSNILVVPDYTVPNPKEAAIAKNHQMKVYTISQFAKKIAKHKTIKKVTFQDEKSKSPQSPPKQKQKQQKQEPIPQLVTIPTFNISKNMYASSDNSSTSATDNPYTIEKLINDISHNNTFISHAITCETECLQNKLVVYRKLAKTDWSAEVKKGANSHGYDTDFNQIINDTIRRIQLKLTAPKPTIEQKREKLLDIIFNPDIGLNTIKGQARQEVRSQIVKFIYMFFKAPTFFSNTFTNFMLTGPAGSGKTKIANTIGHVMSNIGLLVTNTVISATRQSLVGQFIGQGAPKTRFIMAKAIEGVLFIDEAYTLTPCPGSHSKNNLFEKESMGELINLMDKFIGCMVTIVAGYKKEMRECFIPFNEGLSRRFPRVFDLTPYTSEDMWYLFTTFIEPSILTKFSPQQKSLLASYINALNTYDNTTTSINVFSNQAGDMLNLAHLVTEDFLLSEKGYTPKEVTGSFITFCKRKNLDLDI
jgi:DNA replication protein DnaC